MLKHFIIATITAFTSITLSHGEDKPGPNGGFIKMPGAFHTELVPVTKNQIRVFLLDMEWKNPVAEKSSVKVNSIPCKPNGDVFICELGKKFNTNKKGKLVVEATRLEQKGNSVTYDLPLVRH